MKSILALFVLFILLTGCTGGGDSVVSGIGNGGNFFGIDAEAEMLARVMSEDPNVPNVSDADLLKVYESVRTAALGGDIRSSVVLYKLASRQRINREEEDD